MVDEHESGHLFALVVSRGVTTRWGRINALDEFTMIYGRTETLDAQSC